MKTMNKKYIISLVVIVLLIVCIPFVPPIYNRYTKPLYKNYVDAKEWYGKVDCEDLSEVKDYCERRGYSTDYYILVDASNGCTLSRTCVLPLYIAVLSRFDKNILKNR